MSHCATNWAIQQRGLEPATKLLLWQLSDRHNADTGRCFPSQELLAHDCEMSRSTVNRHLKKLEAIGLIRRVQHLNPKTRRQENTSYQIAFDNDFSVSQSDTRAVSQMEQEPCVKSDESRVSNCDTNPVREPSKHKLAVLRDTFLVTALNPKDIIFFVAFLPQFLTPSNLVWPQVVMIEVTFLSLVVISTAVWVLLADTLVRRLKETGRLRILNRIGASFLVGAGTITGLTH